MSDELSEQLEKWFRKTDYVELTGMRLRDGSPQWMVWLDSDRNPGEGYTLITALKDALLKKHGTRNV